MKKLFTPIFIVFVLTGCGGGGSHNKNPATDQIPSSTPSSKSSSAPSSSSTTTSSSSPQTSSSSSTTSSSSSFSSSSQSKSSIAFELTSTGFAADDYIPIKFSCFSTEISPELKWNIVSDDVKSFALIMEDTDAIAIVGHPYVHWNVFNIPAATREISENATLHAMPTGSIEGTNEDGVPKYAGPCPPQATGNHHYHFSLYALNKETLTIDTGKFWGRSRFEQTFSTSIITQTELIGLYKY